MANIITLDMLINKKACQEQIDLFKQCFGESVEITEDLCLKYSNEFHINWLIDNMLNEEQRELYYTIQAPAWKKYLAIQESVYEEYKAIQGPAYEEYEAIEAPALEAYDKEKARAFCVAYNS